MSMNDRDDQEAHSQLLLALGHPLRKTILREMSDTEEISPQECGRQIEQGRGSMKHFYRFAIEEPWALEALGLASPPESP